MGKGGGMRAHMHACARVAGGVGQASWDRIQDVEHHPCHPQAHPWPGEESFHMPQLSGLAACFRQGAREGTLSHRQKTGAEALINSALLFLLIRGG